MTPSYASPEQIRGEAVALLSDIYSLGIVLYEFLTGSRPYQLANLSPQEITRVISEGVIPLPSASVPDRSLSRQLAGDLDNIVMHALENEPQRRYESAALFAEDLQRYLLHEPVRARPQTARYRAYKFLRRYTREVIAVCALFLVMLAGLAAAVRGQRQADARLAQVRELANKLVFDVHDSVQDLPGATKARQVIAQTAVTYLDSTKDAIKGDARAERELASAYRRLGDVQGNAVGSSLGDPKSALVSYRKALDLLENAGSRKPLDLTAQTERLVLYDRIGSLQMHTGKASDAAQILQTGISLGLPSVASGDNSFKAALADLYIDSCDVKRDSGDYVGSLRDATEALHLYQQIQSSGTASTAMLKSLATAHAALGMAEGQTGRMQDALKDYRDGAELMEKLVTSNPQNAPLRRDLMLAYGHIADISGNPSLPNLGDRAAALQAYRKAAEIGRQLYDADPANQRAGVDYGIVLSRIATVTDDRDWKAKAAAHTESLRVLKDVARHNPNDLQVQIYLAFGNLQLAETLRAGGDLAGAEKAYTNAAAIADPARKSGQISFATTFVLANLHLAQVSVARGNRSLALEYAHRAYEASTNLPKGVSPTVIAPRGLAAMGLTYAALARSPLRTSGDRDQAISWLRKSLESWKQAQNKPGFAAPHVREMHEVETTLASLESR
jgi:tetratricopeptide (TPR) repeat protein